MGNNKMMSQMSQSGVRRSLSELGSKPSAFRNCSCCSGFLTP